MEEIITILIVVIGIGIKLFGALKKNTSETDADPTDAWKVLLEGLSGKEPGSENTPESPAPRKTYSTGTVQDVRVYRQSQRDADLLAEQQRYAAMAAAAAAKKRAAADDICACMQEENDAPENENYDPGDWAELTRGNRVEAVIMSEILSKPAALR